MVVEIRERHIPPKKGLSGKNFLSQHGFCLREDIVKRNAVQQAEAGMSAKALAGGGRAGEAAEETGELAGGAQRGFALGDDLANRGHMLDGDGRRLGLRDFSR